MTMARRSDAQSIEIFHLLFLRVLAKGQANWFTLKGGANIRYFFGSPRYSNDIDLDFDGRAGWQVTKTVDSLLSGPALAMLARASNIELVEVSAAKQTETTLRWKIGLSVAQQHALVRTKIEFSGRGGGSDDVAFAVVPNEIVRPYALQAPTVRHYLETAAIDQKIAALALRSETKARDIFDLELLLRQRRATDAVLTDLESTHAAAAAGKALSIPFASFTTEVAPFLDVALADLYDEPVWEAMCLEVADDLTGVSAGATPPGPHA